MKRLINILLNIYKKHCIHNYKFLNSWEIIDGIVKENGIIFIDAENYEIDTNSKQYVLKCSKCTKTYFVDDMIKDNIKTIEQLKYTHKHFTNKKLTLRILEEII